ncbi:hypothetical protein LTR27_010104 [Elasticomyces elasticus]|nr:hypothetical protein LTR27_010104 [Elasticomyces elasticus]
MTTNASESQEQSPLFQLPAELRLVIYELVLVLPSGYCRRRAGDDRHRMSCVPDQDKKVTIVDPKYSTKVWTTSNSYSVLTILQTCRRVRDEAQKIFYTFNHLRVLLVDERSRHDRADITKVLSKLQSHDRPTSSAAECGLPFPGVLGAARKDAIRELTIVVRDSNPESIALVAGAVRDLPELTTLCLEIEDTVNQGMPPKEHRFPDLCRAVAQSRSVQSVSFVIVFTRWEIHSFSGEHTWTKWQQRVRFVQARINALVSGSERRPGGTRTIGIHLEHTWGSEGVVVKGNGPV